MVTPVHFSTKFKHFAMVNARGNGRNSNAAGRFMVKVQAGNAKWKQRAVEMEAAAAAGTSLPTSQNVPLQKVR